MLPEPTSKPQKKGNITLVTRESLRATNLLRRRRRHGEHTSHRPLDGTLLVSEISVEKEQHTNKRLEKDDGYSFDSLPSIHNNHRHSQDYRPAHQSSHSTPTRLRLDSGNGSKTRHVVADVPIFLPLFARRNKSDVSTSPEAVNSSHQHTAARMSHGTSHHHSAARMSHGTSHHHSAARMSHGTSHQHTAARMSHGTSHHHTAARMSHSTSHHHSVARMSHNHLQPDLPVRPSRGNSDSNKISITFSPTPVAQDRAVFNTNEMIGSDSPLNESPRIKLSSFNRNSMKHLSAESDADNDMFPRMNGEHSSKSKVIWFPDAHSKREVDVIYNDSRYGYRTGEYLSSINNYSHSGGKHIGRPHQMSTDVGSGNGTRRDRERNNIAYHQISGPNYDSRYDGHIRNNHGNSRLFSE